MLLRWTLLLYVCVTRIVLFKIHSNPHRLMNCLLLSWHSLQCIPWANFILCPALLIRVALKLLNTNVHHSWVPCVGVRWTFSVKQLWRIYQHILPKNHPTKFNRINVSSFLCKATNIEEAFVFLCVCVFFLIYKYIFDKIYTIWEHTIIIISRFNTFVLKGQNQTERRHHQRMLV